MIKAMLFDLFGVVVNPERGLGMAKDLKVDERIVGKVQEFKETGIKCYAATNLEKSLVDYVAIEKGLGKLFDGVFSSSSVGYSKNDPKFFESVLENIGNPKPQDVLFWDDSIEKVETAKSLGIKAELYTNFEDFEKKLVIFLR